MTKKDNAKESNNKDDERKKHKCQTKDEKEKTKGTGSNKHKDEKQKKEAAQTRNKKRAKRINIESRRAAHKKPTFKRVFLPRLYLCHQEKESRRAAHKKRQKTPFLIIMAYYRQKAEQYRCNTSVLCLYYSTVLLYWGIPFATPSRYADFSKFFLSKF